MEIIARSIRFLYLLWGSLLLTMLTLKKHIQLPKAIENHTWIASFLFISTYGRGLLIGIATIMLLASVIEIWELIDKILKTIFSNQKK